RDRRARGGRVGGEHPLPLGRSAVHHGGDHLYRRLWNARHLVLALYDPVRHHDRRSGGATVQPCLHVLGRGALRVPADADLQRDRLQRISRQGRCEPASLLGPGSFKPQERSMFSRRDILATAAAGAAMTTAATAATFGNPDQPAQGAINAKNPASVTDPGPQNPTMRDQFPSAFSPPATDVGGMPQIWASFNTAPRRIQNGGWARQVTQADFPISTTISGVNMRLSPGGVRELHWHQAAEWAYMTYGNCRVTVLDPQGRPYVADVREGDIWYFPAGYPHSLQGLGPDGCEFVICFDDGNANEYNTLLVTDWFAHTPPSVLAANFGVPAEMFAKIPLHDLWIFQGKVPAGLSADQEAVRRTAGTPPHPFTFSLGSSAPTREPKAGQV